MRVNLAMAGVDHQPFVIRLVNQNVQQGFPYALVPPADKPAVRIAPIPQIRRQIPPRRARADDPEHGVDEQTVVFRHASPYTFPPRQMRLQYLPCVIG